MYLTANVIVEHNEGNDPRIERILLIDRGNDAYVSINVTKAKALPQWRTLSLLMRELDDGMARILTYDSWLPSARGDSELTGAERTGRDRAWMVIESIVTAGPEQTFNSRERGRLINQVMERGLATKPTIYLYLYRYWQGGQTLHALIPHFENSGAAGKMRTATGGVGGTGKRRGQPTRIEKYTGEAVGINVDERIRKLLVKIGEEFYEDRAGLTRTKAFEAGLRKYFNIGYSVLPDGTRVPIMPPPEELPTLRQFAYWYGLSQDRERVIVTRDGQRNHDLKRRGMRGESTSMAYGPGSLYQIDATVGDVYLVSSLDPRLIIGRPVIYVVIDTFSRLVVGFTVGLEGPSWMGMVLAFEHVATDKVEFCRSMGIEITPDIWPVQHFPEAVLGDRGELESGSADALVKGFRLRVANTPPYRADWKGIVERHFGLLNDRIIHWLPGAVRRAVRGDKDYRLEGAMTLAQLRKVLTLCFIEHNQTALIPNYPRDQDMRRDRVRANPLELWHWGIEHRNGALRSFPPEVVRRGLLPRAKAIMTPRGLRYGKLYYTCEVIEAQGWRAKARDGTWQLNVAFDPWSSARIWLQLDGHRDLIPCDEISGMGASGGVPWAELELEAALNELYRRRDEGPKRQVRVQTDIQIQQVLQEARDHINAAPPTESNARRVRNITANRQLEKQIERQINRVDDERLSAPGPAPGPTAPPLARPSNIPLFDRSVSSALDTLSDESQED